MKRIILFSAPTDSNIQQISIQLFPQEIKHKIFAYMPSSGINSPQKYTDFWKKISSQHNAEFRFIDNTNNDNHQKENLLESNILLITGGNTFELLNNLRQSWLDKTIKAFSEKDEFILGGFSAGAIILSPTIKICNLPKYDNNLVGITDLTGLKIVDFEVFPHFEEKSCRKILKKYTTQTNNQIREISNDDYIILDL